MSEVFPPTHEGDTATLAALLAGGLTLRLYTNPVTPDRSLTARSFTEASFPGYRAIDLVASDWSLEEGKGKRLSGAYAAYQTFRRTASGEPEFIHGWYLTTAAGRLVHAGGVPDGPWDMRRATDAVQVQAALVMPEAA